MDRDQIETFIEGAVRYFAHLPSANVEVGAPYLVPNTEPVAFDVSGLVEVSGKSQGCVYFSAARNLLTEVLESLGEPDHREENLKDVAGEIANTLSGNARAEFGSAFEISVPIVMEGCPNMLHLPPDLRSYVIPIEWNKQPAAIGVCVFETELGSRQ